MSSNEWNIPGVVKKANGRPKNPPKLIPKTPQIQERRAKRLLNLLKDDHRFDLVEEIVKTYNEIKLLEDDLVRIRLMRSVQKDLMKYAFPILKAEEGNTDKPAIIINLDIPESKPMRNITPNTITINDDDYDDED